MWGLRISVPGKCAAIPNAFVPACGPVAADLSGGDAGDGDVGLQKILVDHSVCADGDSVGHMYAAQDHCPKANHHIIAERRHPVLK